MPKIQNYLHFLPKRDGPEEAAQLEKTSEDYSNNPNVLARFDRISQYCGGWGPES